ncbi:MULTISPECIES: aldose 1-epimerase family protein [Fusobacterium]|uniref:aldose 1-epimerase family protein n=1 Tax=Fusobacterium TaxID=848 RepID=UPI001476A9E7|nr:MULTISPECIES: aldose 1-epimerase family protein [Fusobacterium]NME36612.1 aldose 1-epimerase family protein [Fusobacterium sp. FSA-380-WT-3A]
MDYIIENSNLKVVINSKGAELTSLFNKKNNFEYIWQKDTKFWAKSSPILFPFVGTIKNEKYSYDGKEYQIKTRHGFARDNEFIVNKQGENFIEFLFSSNEETKKIYPFDFNLYLKYSICENELVFEYKVENLTNGDMYFSLGAHPAFNLFEKNNNFVEFEKDEIGASKIIENGFLGEKTQELFKGKIFKFDEKTFEKDAVILEKTNSKKIFLKSLNSDKKLEFDYEGFKYIAFWNVPGSGFICFEPWDGITDYVNSNGKLEDKIGIEKLEKEQVYQRKIKIKVI